MATEAQAQIDRINAEINTQADKIAQLSAILDGKAGGGGGEVYTIEVTKSVSGLTVYYFDQQEIYQSCTEGTIQPLNGVVYLEYTSESINVIKSGEYLSFTPGYMKEMLMFKSNGTINTGSAGN